MKAVDTYTMLQNLQKFQEGFSVSDQVNSLLEGKEGRSLDVETLNNRWITQATWTNMAGLVDTAIESYRKFNN